MGLKRSRRSEPKPNKSSTNINSSTDVNPNSDDGHVKQLKELSALVDQCLTCTGDGKDDKSVKLSQIVTSASKLLSLSTVPFHTVFEHVPNLCHALVQAAKLSSGVNAHDLVTCFVQMMMRGEEKIDEDDDDKRNVAKRASQWSLSILTKLLRSSKEASSVHDHVFIEPWYKLHEAEVSAQLETISSAIPQLHERKNRSFARTDTEAMVNAILSSTFRLLKQRSQRNDIESLLSVVIEQFSKVSRSINKRKEFNFSSSSSISKILFDFLLADNDTIQSKTFNRLSLSARCELLHQYDRIFNAYIDLLRKADKESVDVDMLTEIVEPLCVTASKHVVVHWKLMDMVYRAVQAESEPFSILLWKDRRWMRCLMTTITRDKLSSWDVMIYRLHPDVRTVVKQLIILLECMYNGGNIEAGVKACEVLHAAVNGDSDCLSVKWQATLIVIEELVEDVIWACARSHAREEQPSGSTLDACCAIILVMQTLRIKGGQTVYDSNGFRRQRQQLAELVSSIWNGQGKRVVKSKLKEQRDFQFTSLFALAVIAARGAEQGANCILDLFSVGIDDDVVLQHELRWAVHELERIENKMGACDSAVKN